MANGPFEDVFPIKTGDIPASYVSLPEGKWSEMYEAPFFYGLKKMGVSLFFFFTPTGWKVENLLRPLSITSLLLG